MGLVGLQPFLSILTRWLIPMAREIVLEIDRDKARVTVRLPEGLEELNR